MDVLRSRLDGLPVLVQLAKWFSLSFFETPELRLWRGIEQFEIIPPRRETETETETGRERERERERQRDREIDRQTDRERM